MQELVARYGRQAGHMLKEFDLDEGNTISKGEFVAVLAAKYQADPARTAKWVAFLANPPAPKRGSKAAEARQRLGITEDEVVFAGVVALHHRSATLYRIHEENWYLCF